MINVCNNRDLRNVNSYFKIPLILEGTIGPESRRQTFQPACLSSQDTSGTGNQGGEAAWIGGTKMALPLSSATGGKSPAVTSGVSLPVWIKFDSQEHTETPPWSSCIRNGPTSWLLWMSSMPGSMRLLMWWIHWTINGEILKHLRDSLYKSGLSLACSALGPKGETELRCGSHVEWLLRKQPGEMRSEFQRQRGCKQCTPSATWSEWLQYEERRKMSKLGNTDQHRRTETTAEKRSEAGA